MAEGPRFCANCGNPLGPEVRFCGECGHPAAPPAAAAPPPPPTAAPTPAPSAAPVPPVEPTPAPRAPEPEPAPPARAPAVRSIAPEPPVPGWEEPAPQAAQAPTPSVGDAGTAAGRPPRRRRLGRWLLLLLVLAVAAGAVVVVGEMTDWDWGVLGMKSQTVTAVTFSPDGRFVGAGTGSGLVLLWDIGSGNEVLRYQSADRAVKAVALSYDGARVAVGTSLGITVVTYSLQVPEGSRVIGSYDVAKGPLSPSPTFLSFQPTDRILVGLDSTFEAVRFWDPRDGSQLEPYRLPQEDGVLDAALSPDHRYLVRTKVGAFVDTWDLLARKGLRQFQGVRSGGLSAVAMASDGWRVACGEWASGSGMAGVLLWDIRQGRIIQEIPAPLKVEALAFSPDGRRIAGGGEGRLLVWDADNGQLLLLLWVE